MQFTLQLQIVTAHDLGIKSESKGTEKLKDLTFFGGKSKHSPHLIHSSQLSHSCHHLGGHVFL